MKLSPNYRRSLLPAMETSFLGSPAEIRAALVRAFANANEVDAAVAFVGEDWWNILGTTLAPVRLVCWLSSTNTNPYAVEQMLAYGFSVRQLDRMHAKVYLTRGKTPSAIIGSANISGAALASDDAAGQVEAAAWVSTPTAIADVAAWFDKIWQQARKISSTDIETAKRAWRAAHAGRERRRQASNSNIPEFLPGDWVPSSELKSLAKQVATMDLMNGREFGDEWEFVGNLDPATMTRSDVEQIFQFLVKWAGHPGVFRPFTQEPIAALRRSFSLVFDESVEVGQRLKEVDSGAVAKLPGLHLPAWSILLQWRFPALYPPFDRRTRFFLEEFELDQFVPRSLTPAGYSRWCTFAGELSARLQLPTPGHVDRMVWAYTRDKEVPA